jgi:hypothetical protein
MAYIGKTPTIGNFQVCDAISVVNGQAAYTMQVNSVNVSPESANHMLVSLNGILQKAGSSFTVSGSTITFASNLVTGDVIDFIQILGNVLDLGVPSDNTVSLAKLTATGTKDATTFLRGDNTFAAAGGGKILQVLTATDSTFRTTTSSSFVTGSNTLSVTITPASTSSKFFIIASTTSEVASGRGYYTIYRGATNLGTSEGLTENRLTWNPLAMHITDSPNTTSAITYQVYYRGNGGTVYLTNTNKGSITVMEISS